MFKRIRYPDGQISAKWEGAVGGHDSHIVKERINSYEDLIYIRAIADVINSGPHFDSTANYRLYIPCMFGQRSDRRFSNMQSFDLKLITDIINDCQFGKVSVFDPHSDVTLALINNSEKVSSFEYVYKAVEDIIKLNEHNSDYEGDLVLISPDAGAYKKVFDYGENLNLRVIAAVKYRDLDGKIDLTFLGDVEGKQCLIVDDLCDGGYTFELLGKALKDQGATKIYLYVSHGLFSKGFIDLQKQIDHVYCTNSVKDIDTCDWINMSYGKVEDYITQFKVI